MTLIEQEIVVSPEVADIRDEHRNAVARVAAWEPAPMPAGWCPAPRPRVVPARPRPWFRVAS